jgi:hypothetical protein
MTVSADLPDLGLPSPKKHIPPSEISFLNSIKQQELHSVGTSPLNTRRGERLRVNGVVEKAE